MSGLLLGLEFENELPGRVRDELEQLISGIQTQFNNIGRFTTVPLAQLEATGNGTMTWTLSTIPEASEVYYHRIANMMCLTVQLQATSVGGVVGAQLRLRIPDGKRVAAGKAFYAPTYISNNGTTAHGYMFVDGRANSSTTPTQVIFARSGGANWTASAAATEVYGQLWFEVEG